jgi:hypothetical protein
MPTKNAPATPVVPSASHGRARGDLRRAHLMLGLALAGAAVAIAVATGISIWSVALWAVLPDAALLLAVGAAAAPGQLPRWAVPAYNLLHAPALPLALLAGVGAGLLGSYWLVAGTTWLAHISIDRGCGYGPRTPEGWQRA